MKKQEYSWMFIFTVLVVGATAGGIIGQVLGALLPALDPYISKGIVISLKSTILDLYFLQIPVGFLLKFNIFSLLGIFLVFCFLRKL